MATQRVERRLSAILAADIVGYSRLVERDEAGTLGTIKGLRETAIDPLLAEHQGRIVKLMGDGAIVEFGSVVDAVACAVAVQKAVAENQVNTPAARRIVFRMGVNLGDVVVDGEDLLGDGVNVAARLEQLCEPGGVLVSGTAFDQLQGKLGLPLEFTGEQRVKNIERSVRVYRVRLDGKGARFRLPYFGRSFSGALVAVCLLLASAAGWWWYDRAPDVPALPVVAVLAFTTPGDADPRLAKLADGLTSSVTDALSISRVWTVLGRGTSLAYRDRPDATRDLGREVGASFVVQGMLTQAVDHLRASVELIDARSGDRLWSERFERPIGDWAAIEDELGARIGNALYRDAIRQTLRQRAARRPTYELKAHELALMADDQSELFTKEANATGLELTKQALIRDPLSSFALYIRGRLFRQQVDEGFASAVAAMEGWGEAVRKLVDIDPNYAWGHLDLAVWYAYGEKNDALVLAELDRALELAPNNPQILTQVAAQLPWLGQPGRAAALLDRAARYDPRMRFDWRQYQVGFFLGRFHEAVDLIESFNETGRWDHLFATLSYAQLGDETRSAGWRARLASSWPDYSWELSASESGDFSTAAAKERTLWLDSHAKAGLPRCATSEQVAALKIRPLPECDAERAKPSAAR